VSGKRKDGKQGYSFTCGLSTVGCRLWMFQAAENVKKADKKCKQQIRSPSTTAAVAHKNILTSCFYMDIIRDAKAGNLTKTLFIPALTL
jgi:hypothetical protein